MAAQQQSSFGFGGSGKEFSIEEGSSILQATSHLVLLVELGERLEIPTRFLWHLSTSSARRGPGTINGRRTSGVIA